ncbi:MAG: DUF3488 domain-containing protein [Deltaproteobacteria bacterium]|nr:DUF3488 domain-containing protein [Candidatus Zymogenaceae bacterium]
MRINTQFKIASYGVIAAGFITLLLTGRLGIVQTGVMAVSFIVSWRFGSRIADLPHATKAANVLIVSILGILLVRFIFLDASFVTTTVDFFIFVQAIRILFLTQLRHYLQSYLISLFSVLVATVLTFSPIFFAMFVVYLFVATYAMILFTMVSEIHRIKGAVNDDLKMHGRPLIVMTFLTTLFVIVSGSLVFITFPRLSFGFLPSSIMEPVGITGFSENVALGEVGELKISEAVIMRVVIGEDDLERMGAGPYYFKGTAFDHFDGTYWERTVVGRTTIAKRYNRFILEKDTSGTVITQEYFMEPTDSRVLFTWGTPIIVDGPFVNLHHDAYGTLEFSRSFLDKIRYTVYSVPTDEVWANDWRGDFRSGLDNREEYLQLPVGLDPRIPALTGDLTDGLTGDEIKTEAIRDYLIEYLAYDLNTGMSGDDPLADFLFEEKKGYCEHFATAMTIMLRTQGIPARLATGFLSGEFNEYGSFFIIRASDAHAWVEVYLDGRGWVIFDPTPPAGRTTFTRRPGLRALVDTLIMRWNIYVVNYEIQDQLGMIEGTIEATERGKKKLFSWKGGIDKIVLRIQSLRSGDVTLPVVGIIGIGMITAAVFIWFLVQVVVLRRSRRRAGVAGEYDRLVKLAKRKGVVREKWITHREFAEKLADHWPGIADDVFDVTDIYSGVRFGDVSETEEEIRDVHLMVSRIAAVMKNETMMN